MNAKYTVRQEEMPDYSLGVSYYNNTADSFFFELTNIIIVINGTQRTYSSRHLEATMYNGNLSDPDISGGGIFKFYTDLGIIEDGQDCSISFEVSILGNPSKYVKLNAYYLTYGDYQGTEICSSSKQKINQESVFRMSNSNFYFEGIDNPCIVVEVYITNS